MKNGIKMSVINRNIKEVYKILNRLILFGVFALLLASCSKKEKIAFEEIEYEEVNEADKIAWLGANPFDVDRNITGNFIEVITNPDDYYMEVFSRTKVLKLYIEAMSRHSDKELRDLAMFCKSYNLEVAVELGGMRIGVGYVPNDQIGEKSAEFEYEILKRFMNVGGIIDYISTDHSMAPYITGRDNALEGMSMKDISVQQMEYFKYILVRNPNIKVGAIESLGFFWVNGDREYQATDPTLDRVDFENYLDVYLEAAAEYEITIDHYHIDFGLHDTDADGGYGRIFAVEDYVRSKGIDAGLIAANAWHDNTIDPFENQYEASVSAAANTLKYFEEYMKLGGDSDSYILQRWQNAPVELGSYKYPYTQMGIYNSMVISPYFPAKEEVEE